MSRMPGKLEYDTTMDIQKFIKNANRAIAKQEAMVQSGKKINRQATRNEKTYSKMLGTIGRFASAGAIIGGIGRALAFVEQEATSALERLKQLEVTTKNLAQISGGSPQELARLRSLSKAVSVSTGIPLAQSEDIVQKGLSSGLTETDIADLTRTKFFEADPGKLIEAIADFRNVFGGATSGLTGREILNAVLQAQVTTKRGAAQVAELALSPSQLAKALGGTAAEAVGLTAVSLVGAQTPEIGATQAQAFLKQLFVDPEKRFEGLGVRAGFEKFSGLSKEEQDAIVGGRKEAIIFATKLRTGGFELVENEVAKAEAAMRATGTPESLFAKNLRAARANAPLAAIDVLQRGQARYAAAGEPIAQAEAVEDALRAEIKGQLLEDRAGIIKRMAAGFTLFLYDQVFQASPEAFADLGAGILARPPERYRSDVKQELLDFVPDVLRSPGAPDEALVGEMRGLRTDLRENREEAVPLLRGEIE